MEMTFSLFRARTVKGAQIKSWRAWILWIDNDWTCETMKSFDPYQVQQIEKRIQTGTDVWPWPERNSPKDKHRRKELKSRNMVSYNNFCIKIFISFQYKWQDPSPPGSIWTSIPQTERQTDDEDDDIPDEKDDLFEIQSK